MRKLLIGYDIEHGAYRLEAVDDRRFRLAISRTMSSRWSKEKASRQLN